MKPVGHGILTWDGPERRTDRYGMLALGGQDYGNTASVEPWLADLSALEGKRVRIECVVDEGRKYVQTKKLEAGDIRVSPKVERLGGGAFMLTTPVHAVGNPLDYEKK